MKTYELYLFKFTIVYFEDLNKKLIMKKIYIFIMMILLIFGCGNLYIKLTRSDAFYYKTVSSFINENGKDSFYDFYLPQSYLDGKIK